MPGALAGGSAFCAGWKTCRKLREVMQATEDGYLQVYACRLEEFAEVGDIRGWYEHLKGGWNLQGKKVGSAQYIRDKDGKLLRKLEQNRARWRRAVASLLNTASAALNRTMIDGLLPKPVTLSLGDPPVLNELKPAPSYMANCKAMGPNELPAELPKLGFATVPTKYCSHSTA